MSRVAARPGRSPLALLVFPPVWRTVDMPPLGPAVLAGALKAAGIECAVLDLNLTLHKSLRRLPRAPGVSPGAPQGGGLAALQGGGLAALAFALGMDSRFPVAAASRYVAGVDSPDVSLTDLADPAGTAVIGSRATFWDHWSSLAVAAKIAPMRPTLVGITICHCDQVLPALALARAARRLVSPPPLLVAGGPWCTTMAAGTADLRPLLRVFDAVGVGPGEHSLVRLARASPAALPREMPGVILAGTLSSARSSARSIAPEAPAPASPDFASLPLAAYFDGRPAGFPLESSRGCPWRRCRFCNYHRLNRGYTEKPIHQVVAEVVAALRLWPGAGITFVDDVLTPERVLELATAMTMLRRATGLSVDWAGSLRPDAGLTPAQCRILRAAGLNRAFIGLEAATQHLLERADKGATVEGATALVRNLREAGIRVAANFICGLPGETGPDRVALARLVEDLGLDPADLTFSRFAVARGSWHYQHMEEMGYPSSWIERVRANNVLTDFLPPTAGEGAICREGGT
jgi:anaerobic magnesium-protoporphyrin IX monomethyl ester cyclase